MKRPLAAPFAFCLAALIGAVQPAATAAPQPVDAALVLAVDVSGSVNDERFNLQRDGYAAAFASPQVADAIAAGPNHAILVTLVEWSGTGQQKQVIDWTVLDGKSTAESFGSALAEMPRAFSEMTALGDAIDYAGKLLRNGGFGQARLIVDVSGDGSTNAGRRANLARDDAVAAGVTINGLPILAEEPNLDKFYRENVIGGEDAFLVVAHGFDDFADAIRNKLVREIAGVRDPRIITLAAGPGFGP
jgi:hypothetical protein